VGCRWDWTAPTIDDTHPVSDAGGYAGRRDPRFVTIRRGGLLDDASHRLLVAWAADCAAHVLDLFTVARPGDDRPAAAIMTARRWAAGKVSTLVAREAAYAAHAAARDASGAAQHVARAAGHAVATAHMADHELGAAFSHFARSELQRRTIMTRSHTNVDGSATGFRRRWPNWCSMICAGARASSVRLSIRHSRSVCETHQTCCPVVSPLFQ
jgi:hypothetical protein